VVEYVLLLPREQAETVNTRVFGMPLLARVVYRLENEQTSRVTLAGDLPAAVLCAALGDYPKHAELSLHRELMSSFSPCGPSKTLIFWDATFTATKDLPDLLRTTSISKEAPVALENAEGESLGAMAIPASLFEQGLNVEGVRSVKELRARLEESNMTTIETLSFDSYAQCQSEPGSTPGLKRQLLNELKKPVEIDGPTAAYLQRPIALILTRMLAWSPIRPNHATALALVIGLVGALCMASGSELGFIIGGSLMVVGAIVDCIDGNIARLKDQGSYTGAWFDTITDDICNLTFIAGTGIGLYRAYGETWMLFLGLGAVIISIPGILVQYRILHSLHLADVCDYPWLFNDKDSTRVLTRLETVMNYMKYLMKRDTYIMIFLAFILLGYTWLIVAFSFLGGVIFETAFVVDLKKKRRMEGPKNLDAALMTNVANTTT
jgi:phosphatidylglycerophosphate synthase